MTSKNIIFQIGAITIVAKPRNTPTANAITKALPIESSAQTWGEEVYFATSVSAELEADARAVVEAGEIAFWVEGQCIAIGFGPTPISHNDEIRLAARTNIWADAIDDVRLLKSVSSGETIKVDWAS